MWLCVNFRLRNPLYRISILKNTQKNTSSLVHSDVEVKELNTVEERLVKNLRSRVAALGIPDGKSPRLSWTFPLKLCEKWHFT